MVTGERICTKRLSLLIPSALQSTMVLPLPCPRICTAPAMTARSQLNSDPRNTPSDSTIVSPGLDSAASARRPTLSEGSTAVHALLPKR
eukprot:CAMPEP_0172004880 /NCGR_PEP_ID=MMETSP1041-20130122/4734_1 /TAXON_ID=464988 /ORGANISM="Hemiselmis andersenii, Strain CCMP439" /LENGTH=88 /DNA_ID=CAMNT_0012658807 /DNA_START=271 /DNA_END=534 /DNA_ORIENTATION=+